MVGWVLACFRPRRPDLNRLYQDRDDQEYDDRAHNEHPVPFHDFLPREAAPLGGLFRSHRRLNLSLCFHGLSVVEPQLKRIIKSRKRPIRQGIKLQPRAGVFEPLPSLLVL